MSGIIETLGLKEIEKEIQALSKELETAKTNLLAFGEQFTAVFKEGVEVLKEIKKAANFTELSQSGQKAAKVIQELTAQQKEQAAQQKTVAALTARLAALENKEAQEIQRLRIEIAEKNRQQKIEAQAQVSVQKDIKALIAAYKEQSGSIRELVARNKELRTVRDDLDTETQKADIEELNKIIDANTAVIKANQDSYVQQKMTIGDYKTAIEGVKVQINGAQALMVKIAEETGANSKEYLAASASLNDLNKQLEDYTQGLSKAEQEISPLKKRLSELKKEMEDLNLKGRNNWKDEEVEAYRKAADEAKKLQKAIQDANKEIEVLAHNNTGLNAIIEGLETVTAGFAVWEGTTALLGADTEEFREILLNLQGAMAIINGLQQISETLRAKSIVMIKLQTLAESKNNIVKGLATLAQKALNAAQKAMPFLMIISAIGLLISAFGLFSKKISATEQAQKDLNKAQQEAVKSAGEQAGKLEALAKAATKANVSVLEQQTIIKNLNETVKESGRMFKTFEEAQKFLVEEKDIYINSLLERAKAQALLSQYTKTYSELLEKRMKKEQENTDDYDDKIEEDKEKLKWLVKQMSIEGFSGGVENMQAQMRDMLNVIDEANKTEEQKLKDKYDHQKLIAAAAYEERKKQLSEQIEKEAKAAYNSIIAKGKDEEARKAAQDVLNKYEQQLEKEHNDALTKIDEQYYKDKAALAKKAADESIKAVENISALRLENMEDGYKKELAAINAAEQKELAAVKGTAKQKAEQIEEIEKKYGKKRLELNKTWTKQLVDDEINHWNLKASVTKKGSIEQYNALSQANKLSEQQEIDAENERFAKAKEAQENLMRSALTSTTMSSGLVISTVIAANEELQRITKQHEENINNTKEKYRQEDLTNLADVVDANIAAEMREAEARLQVIQEMQSKEEAALLDKYKNGLISKEQYEEQKAAVQEKYSQKALEDEIATLEALLKETGLTDDQLIDLRKQLADRQKELSDKQTNNELTNIEKVNKKRKKAAELAKEYAEQAFEVGMEFLTQMSEAKIEELDAEIERIEQWKEAELARLEESVMSEETRAAEKKRIEEEAAAKTKQLEEEKRKEQIKQFRFQQLQSVAQTAMNTAQAIMASAKMGFPAAIPFIAMAAALGAIQTAMILAQKPPAYAEGIFGDEAHGGGYAVVGDAYRKEYGLLPSGKLFETPAFPTLLDLPKGTQIFPDYMTMLQNLNPIPKYEKTVDFTANFEDYSEKIIEAIKKNKVEQNVSLNLDNRGIWYVTKNKNVKIKHVNKKLWDKK